MSKTSTVIILLLVVIVALLAWMVFVKPAEAPSVPAATTTGSTGGSDDTPPVTTPAPRPLHERVQVTSPKANASVAKKFSVTGKAPGNWFFEASAPIMVRDSEGNKLGQSYIQAQGDWMTTELVDFKGELTISSAFSGPAILVLMKDNPSGLPEHDDSLEIPIVVE